MNKHRAPWTITRDKFLTKDEVRRLYSALETSKAAAIAENRKAAAIRDAFLIRLLLETGLRVSELVALKISDFRAGSLTVCRGKGGKARTVLLTSATQTLIHEYLDTKTRYLDEPVKSNDYLIVSERRRPFTTRGVRARVKYWYKTCGLPAHLSCHSARHTYISFMIVAGVDLGTLKTNVGHSSLSVTSIYAHCTRDGLGDIDLYNSASTTNRHCSIPESFSIKTHSQNPSPIKVDHKDSSFHIENVGVHIKN